jgi:hypothetical protein
MMISMCRASMGGTAAQQLLEWLERKETSCCEPRHANHTDKTIK